MTTTIRPSRFEFRPPSSFSDSRLNEDGDAPGGARGEERTRHDDKRSRGEHDGGYPGAVSSALLTREEDGGTAAVFKKSCSFALAPVADGSSGFGSLISHPPSSLPRPPKALTKASPTHVGQLIVALPPRSDGRGRLRTAGRGLSREVVFDRIQVRAGKGRRRVSGSR